MAHAIVNKKGFLAVQCTAYECRIALKATGMCMFCENTPMLGYYVPILNTWLCTVCYHDWLKTATRYPEDVGYEEQNFKRCADLLNLIC